MQQVITLASVDPDIYCQLVSLGLNVLSCVHFITDYEKL